mmetsp:Transcript_23126/g.22589  ORF Transcript_23126/g.22589 Transcript_23126/m.22589 type:complete len:247 (+) Transcript_23126:1460-2200(+)
MKSEGRPIDENDEEIKQLLNVEDDEYIYRLVGVNIHIGTAEHGHYYSLINTKRGVDEPDEAKPEWAQPEKDMWKQFEDDKIKHYSFSDMKLDSYGGMQETAMNEYEINAYLANTGGSFGKNAYMLVYERKKKKDLREVSVKGEEEEKGKEEEKEEAGEEKSKEQQQIDASLDCALTATSRAANEDKEPQETMIDFKKVAPYVPEHLKQMVITDNASNMVELHIFNDGFFNSVKALLKHIGDKVLMS